mmetsp:Transcript_26885/g.57222  ORF Transcript_26885/g.57222 Transcript_26885/m.57222 type:complete len:305 (+) Transcript_26885:208-1122(+)
MGHASKNKQESLPASPVTGQINTKRHKIFSRQLATCLDYVTILHWPWCGQADIDMITPSAVRLQHRHLSHPRTVPRQSLLGIGDQLYHIQTARYPEVAMHTNDWWCRISWQHCCASTVLLHQKLGSASGTLTPKKLPYVVGTDSPFLYRQVRGWKTHIERLESTVDWSEPSWCLLPSASVKTGPFGQTLTTSTDCQHTLDHIQTARILPQPPCQMSCTTSRRVQGQKHEHQPDCCTRTLSNRQRRGHCHNTEGNAKRKQIPTNEPQENGEYSTTYPPAAIPGRNWSTQPGPHQFNAAGICNAGL